MFSMPGRAGSGSGTFSSRYFRRHKTPTALSASSVAAQSEAFFDERESYLAQLAALKKLQSAVRRRRWRVALSAHIPIIEGPWGLWAFPIYRGLARVGMEGPSGRQYRGTSLCCLGPELPLREWICFVCEHPLFERASLIAVLANCVALAVQPPASVHYLQELLFTVLFTLELLCRAAAMGFAGHEHSYLSDA